MAVEESRKSEVEMAPSQLDKKKFADFVRIHAIDGDLITRESEMAILKEGITRFGLNLDEANGIMLSVVAEHDIALVSHAEHHIGTLLEQLVKKGKISQKEFDDAVAIYKKLTNGGVPDSDLEKRVKQMVEERGWNGRKTRWLLGSRKWFRRI
jgi:polyhydroxyalkanoate synthesis regulator phasin